MLWVDARATGYQLDVTKYGLKTEGSDTAFCPSLDVPQKASGHLPGSMHPLKPAGFLAKRCCLWPQVQVLVNVI